MADNISGTSVFKEEVRSNYGSTTLIIIIFLLVLIISIMAYNYWVIYTYTSVPKNIDFEAFGQSDKSDKSDKSGNSIDVPKKASNKTASIVADTMKKVANIEEGEMSAELRSYYDDRSSARNNDEPIQESNVKEKVKCDLAEKNVIKFIIYHMSNCGHCFDIMEQKQGNNNKTKFEELNDIFINDDTIQILDFKYGRDDEAKKYTAFPQILIVTENGTEEYNGYREVEYMAKAIINKKMN